MLDFEGTETTGNRILNFLRRSSYDVFLIQAHTENPVLNCTANLQTK